MDLLVFTNEVLGFDWAHAVICLSHDTVQIKFSGHFE